MHQSSGTVSDAVIHPQQTVLKRLKTHLLLAFIYVLNGTEEQQQR